MTSSLAKVTIFSFLFLLFIPHIIYAETKTFIKEYTYQASEDDSRNSSRTLALREVKRLLLEELGTYLESVTEVQNFQLTKDQIITLTAGIVQTQIVDEKWDGHAYWLKLKITADSGNVIKSIDALRKDRQKTKELEDVRKRSDELSREVERLRKELTAVKDENRAKKQAAYNEAINGLTAIEWYEKGFASTMLGNHSDGINAFTKAIELNPEYVEAYVSRCLTYAIIGNSRLAIEDCNKAIKLNPKDAVTYVRRGTAHNRLGNNRLAIEDFERAIKLNPKLAMAYYNRGMTVQ